MWFLFQGLIICAVVELVDGALRSRRSASNFMSGCSGTARVINLTAAQWPEVTKP